MTQTSQVRLPVPYKCFFCVQPQEISFLSCLQPRIAEICLPQVCDAGEVSRCELTVMDVCATPADSTEVGDATGDDVPDVLVLLLARVKELVLDLDDCTPEVM